MFSIRLIISKPYENSNRNVNHFYFTSYFRMTNLYTGGEVVDSVGLVNKKQNR